MKLEEFVERLGRIREVIGPEYNDDEINIRFREDYRSIGLMTFNKGFNGDLYCTIYAQKNSIQYISDEPLGKFVPTYESFMQVVNEFRNTTPATKLVAKVIVVDEWITCHIDGFNLEIVDVDKGDNAKITIIVKFSIRLENPPITKISNVKVR